MIRSGEFGVEQPLSIAVAQPRCIAFDVTSNAVAHAQAVRAAEARVVVFPEMSLTGYELDAEQVVPEDERLAPIVAACSETRTLALIGAPVPGPCIGILAVDVHSLRRHGLRGLGRPGLGQVFTGHRCIFHDRELHRTIYSPA